MLSAYDTITRIIAALPPCECRDRLTSLKDEVLAGERDRPSGDYESVSRIIIETCPVDLMVNSMGVLMPDWSAARKAKQEDF